MLSEDWSISAALGYERTDFDGERSYGESKGDAAFGGLGVTRPFGAFELGSAATLGWGRCETERDLSSFDVAATAEDDYDALSIAGRVGAAYNADLGGAWLRPALDLDVVHVSADRYTESGGGALELRVEDSDETAFVATPSLEVGTIFSIGEGFGFRTYARGAVSVSTLDKYEARAGFAGVGAGGFTSAVVVSDLVGRVGVGVDLLGKGNVDLGLRYDGAFSDTLSGHAASQPELPLRPGFPKLFLETYLPER